MHLTFASRPTAELRRTTLAEEVRERLADDILFGRLSPGTHLDEQALAERYGTSRTPVREALKQLAATGLAETRPRKGVLVSTVTPQRLALMFQAIAELESACARFAASEMADDERQQLRDLHLLAAAARDDADRYARLNMEFHAVILRGCHNSFLSEPAFTLRTRSMPFRRAQFQKSATRLGQSFAEHEAVVAAILDHDPEAAFDAMRAHLGAAYDASARLLPIMD